MASIGYARVSSTGQSLDIQLEKLNAAGCTEIFKEKLSGTKNDRPELAHCLKYVRKGDTLVVTRLDRLARSTAHLHNIANDLRKREIDLVVLDQNIDTCTPTGRLLFSMLAAIAEFENDLRRERQSDGIKKALNNGVKFGRREKLSGDQIIEMRAKRASGVLIKDLMADYGLSKASVYRLLSEED